MKIRLPNLKGYYFDINPGKKADEIFINFCNNRGTKLLTTTKSGKLQNFRKSDNIYLKEAVEKYVKIIRKQKLEKLLK